MCPCNAVAVQTAQLRVDALEVIGNPAAIEAVSKLLSRLWNCEVNALKDRGGVRFVGENRNWVSVQRGTYSAITAFPKTELESARAIVEQVVGLVLQARVRAAVASRYAVLEEQTTPAGAVVMSIDL